MKRLIRTKNKKMFVLLILSMFLMINLFPVAVSANVNINPFDVPSPFGEGSMTGESSELIDNETRDALDKAEEEANLTDGIIIGFIKKLLFLDGINKITTLVFDNPYETWFEEGGGELKYGLFYESELNSYIKPLVGIFAATYVSFVAISVMISSARMGLKAYSPQQLSDFWNDLQMWILSAFFMGLFWWIAQIIFGLNFALVQTLKTFGTETLGLNMNGLSVVAQAGKGLIFGLTDIMVLLVEWGLTLFLNIVYIIRKVIIVILIIMAPLAAISLLYAKTRNFFGTWLKEFVGNVFLQSIHAVVLMIFAGMATFSPGMLFKIGLLIMFIPVSGMFSQWLNIGDSSTKLGQAATMMGIGGVVSTAMLARSGAGMLRNARNKERMDSGSGSNNIGSDTGKTGISEAAKGTHSKGWQRTKKGIGMAAAGSGALIGLGAAGPMGAAVGGVIGQKVGSAAAQGSRNLAIGSAKTGKVLSKIYKEGDDPTAKNPITRFGQRMGSGFKNVWSDLEGRRNMMGKLGESVGTTFSMGSIGRKTGLALSGVSQNRIADERYGNLSLQDIQKKYPGARFYWEQDNQKSALYMDQNGKSLQISPFGSADSSLKNGEKRRIDYQFTKGTSSDNTPFQRTSDAYIVSENDKFQDSRIDAKSVNIDEYFKHNIKDTDLRSGTNKNADRIGKYKPKADKNKNAEAWTNPPRNGRRFSGYI